jgi:protein-arginine kinase activator protein McsA
MKECTLCKGEGINKPAIGKYYLPKAPGQFQSGWIAVCEGCAEMVSRYFDVERYDGIKPDQKAISKICTNGEPHKWHKISLVTQSDKHGMYDLWSCDICGMEYKRRSLNDDMFIN